MESSDEFVYLSFGRLITSSPLQFESDVILKIKANEIHSSNSHDTEFEVSSKDIIISYRSPLQNCIKEVNPKEFKISMNIKESIYPSVSFSAVIDVDGLGDNFTVIEMKATQDIPEINSFIYYPIVISLFLCIVVLISSIVESNDQLRYKGSNSTQKIFHIIHWYYVVVFVELISTYIADYYSYFALLKVCAMTCGYIMLFSVLYLLISFSEAHSSLIRLGAYFTIFYLIFHIVIFNFYVYDLFWIYVLPNLWIYAVITNIWISKFIINFIIKWRISTIWPSNIQHLNFVYF